MQQEEKRGEKFGRLGSCTARVQANKVQTSYGHTTWHIKKYS
ncbi:hypothetical protein F3D3_2340 [Fusibacter sp. 3D3]|nr:hypothetical protein F3D3_2340 [Fusibacter sp. 3D3]